MRRLTFFLSFSSSSLVYGGCLGFGVLAAELLGDLVLGFEWILSRLMFDL